MSFQLLTFNFKSTSVRYDTLEGREHIVVPMVMMTEGVHAGSGGPLYYPGDELARSVPVWNHKPVVIYHPVVNGKPVSACDPVQLNTRKVGVILNTKYDSKLRAEAWLEKSRLEEVDDRVLEAIENNKLMEVSTGVFTDNKAEPGEWNGEKYDAIAMNYRADHLAILPDQIGACSIADGAGLLQVNSKALGLPPGFIYNAMSFSNISSALYPLLRNRLAGDEDVLWIEDVYPDFVVYQLNGQLYRLDYSVDQDVVALEGEASKVKRVTEYRTLDGSFVGNSGGSTSKTETIVMTRKDSVDRLISNGGWDEKDRDWLTGLSDADFARIPVVANNDPDEDEDEDEDDDDGVTDNAANSPSSAGQVRKAMKNAKKSMKGGPNLSNYNKQPVSLDEYISTSPAELQDVLREGVLAHNTMKKELVAKIVSNKRNTFTEDYLKGRTLEELRGLASLAEDEATPQQNRRQSVLQPNYGGAAGGGSPVVNSSTKKPDPLPVPTMNFGAPATKQAAAAVS